MNKIILFLIFYGHASYGMGRAFYPSCLKGEDTLEEPLVCEVEFDDGFDRIPCEMHYEIMKELDAETLMHYSYVNKEVRACARLYFGESFDQIQMIVGHSYRALSSFVLLEKLNEIQLIKKKINDLKSTSHFDHSVFKKLFSKMVNKLVIFMLDDLKKTVTFLTYMISNKFLIEKEILIHLNQLPFVTNENKIKLFMFYKKLKKDFKCNQNHVFHHVYERHRFLRFRNYF